MSGEPVPPVVSIIVPSYNMGRFLPATLDSIFAQSYRPLEVVVVDGASNDETVEVLDRYAASHPELRWVSEPDEGPEDAINKGLSMITGEIAGIQSADDIYYPDAIGTAVATFSEHPDAAIVYGDAALIDGEGRTLSRTHYLRFTLPRYLCGSTFIPQSSAFFRPALARKVGGVRRRYFVFDIDLWIRMLFHAPAVKIDQVLSAYRRHEAQRDKETDQIYSSWRRMLAESPEIRAAPWRVRQASRAGARMIIQFYNPSGSARYAAAQMWLAIVLYPPVVRAISKPRKLIPPPPTVRGAFRRLRRLAGQTREAGR